MTDPQSRSFDAIGTTAVVLVTDPAAAGAAERMLRDQLAELDAACSRFRGDSELSRLHERAGRWVSLSPLLARAVGVALRAAEATDGLVDPTVGRAVRNLGYDRDFAALPRDDDRPVPPARVAPGWWRVLFDAEAGRVLLPRRLRLDLGATAKALAADRAAAAIHSTVDCGILVSLGGDLAVAGPSPSGGWLVAVGDDGDAVQVVSITSGGLATSGTVRRRWRRAGAVMHHIVDPRTGEPAKPFWRTASVAALSCVDANTASTAAIVLANSAPTWLQGGRLPARLVDSQGAVVTTAGWPTARQTVAA